MIHERCYLCNKVSSMDIETNVGDFTKKRFFRDSYIPHLTMCEECKEVYEDVMLGYEQQDDIYGWIEYANDNQTMEEDISDLVKSETPAEDEG